MERARRRPIAPWHRGMIRTLLPQNDFLCTTIHWGPKSRSVQQIADELNLNVDTLELIDDSTQYGDNLFASH